MELETTEMLTSWTNGTAVPAYGVNALLAGIPRSAGHPLPADLRIVSELTDGWVARDQAPQGELDRGPILALSIWSPTTLEPMVHTDTHLDSEVELMMRFLLKDAESHEGTRDIRYYQRALRRSLVGLMLNEHAEHRLKNAILIYELVRLRQAEIFADKRDTPVAIGTIATFKVRDEQPLPT